MVVGNMNIFDKLLGFLADLEEHRIQYFLEHKRADAIMVTITVPREKWEVEFFADGHVEVDMFRSTATKNLKGEEVLKKLFKE